MPCPYTLGYNVVPHLNGNRYNGVQSLINGVQSLINGVQRLINGVQRLINGVQSLMPNAPSPILIKF